MDKVTIWLADENEHYVELMKRYIRTSNFNNRLNIAAYTDLQCFEHALEHFHSDTIIVASALFLPLCTSIQSSSIILLSDEMNGGIANSLHYVYKYRPLNQLLDQVLNMYYEGKSDVSLGYKGAYNELRAIAVYAASGGCGVTTMATQLAEIYASLGKKVFYLNLEPIHSMLPTSTDAATTRFTQVLYTIKSGQPLLGKLQQLLQTDHIGQYDMFHPARYSREWSEYEREDIQLLLQAIEQTGRYDIIVMDVGNVLNNATVGALEHSDEILWMIPDRRSAWAKVEYIKAEIRKLSSQLYDRIHTRGQYVLQLNGTSREMETNSKYDISTILPFIPEWQHSADGLPPAAYRQALIRLIGITTKEELELHGAADGQSIHRLA